jgi:8-oxo-dGTP pyrophosphatase MutT (NUDIX family)
MLKFLSEVLASDPAFRPNWKAQPPDVLAENTAMGSLIHVVAANEGGQPLYDSPLWLERTGAIGVPVDQDGRLVLLKNFRRAPCNTQHLGQIPFTDLAACGRSSIELPRGFPELNETPDVTAVREVSEETGYSASSPVYLGATNCNTTFFPFSNHVYLVSVDTQQPRKAVEEVNERIEEVLVMTWNEVLDRIARDSIVCGMTKSALMSYAAWLSQHR